MKPKYKSKLDSIPIKVMGEKVYFLPKITMRMMLKMESEGVQFGELFKVKDMLGNKEENLKNFKISDFRSTIQMLFGLLEGCVDFEKSPGGFPYNIDDYPLDDLVKDIKSGGFLDYLKALLGNMKMK